MQRILLLITLAATGGALHAEEMYVVPEGVETRWASPENPSAQRARGATANAGRKGAAFFTLEAGKQHTLAEVTGTSGMVRRIWMTLNDRSPRMPRGMRIAERPVNRRCAPHRLRVVGAGAREGSGNAVHRASE